MDSKYAGIKARLFSNLPAVAVELGPGVGANLRYLPRGTRLIAFEPNRQMHRVLSRRASEYGIALELRGTAAETLDLPSESVDFVFGSLVLCSVGEPERVVAEVRRLLRPGGRFACVEHVAAPEGSGIHHVQRICRRGWQWVFEGCDLCRDTESLLRSAGFAHVEVQRLTVPTVLLPLRHQIAAMCIN